MKNLTLFTPKSLWDSYRSLGEIHDDFDRFFNNMMPTSELASNKDFYPRVDILEENDKYLIKAELPGVNQKDVKITLNDNVLNIRGERKSEYEENKEGIHRIERSFGSFSRSFPLDKEVIPEKVTASYKDGILTIDLPKSNKEVKEIEVKIS